jgi:hypothetical protein
MDSNNLPLPLERTRYCRENGWSQGSLRLG